MTEQSKAVAPAGAPHLNTHGLERTSPKGGPFLGRCVYCGQINLPMGAALLPCADAPPPQQQVLEAIAGPTPPASWPDPTPEMLNDLIFEAIWQTIKRWDINVPHVYTGYCGATGNHVRAILDAIRRAEAGNHE